MQTSHNCTCIPTLSSLPALFHPVSPLQVVTGPGWVPVLHTASHQLSVLHTLVHICEYIPLSPSRAGSTSPFSTFASPLLRERTRDADTHEYVPWVCAQPLQLCLTLGHPAAARQAPLSMGVSRQESWSGCVPSSRGSSRPRGGTCVPFVSCTEGGFLAPESPGKPCNRI